jgi:uncharacterized membrane protein (TIGR02234 family)
MTDILEQPRTIARRSFIKATALAGGGLLLAAASQPWAHVTLDAGAGAPLRSVALDGDTLAGALPALGLIGLAGVAAAIATKGTLRRLVGLVLDGAGIWAIVVAVLGRAADHVNDAAVGLAPGSSVTATSATAWPWLAVVGGVLLSSGGALIVVSGHRWAGLSGRYEAPSTAAEAPNDPWAALDRGDDPTA